MRILGIDPGTAIVGYGIIEVTGNKFKVVDYGCVRTASTLSLPDRLEIIFDELTQLIERYKPTECAIEELFFNKNVRTALAVGQGRGVAMLAAKKARLNILEFTPLQVKQAVVGYGRADKNQVQYMVKTLLNLESIPKPDDAADGLALAICYAHFVSDPLIAGRRNK